VSHYPRMGSALVCVELGVGPKFEPNKFGVVEKKITLRVAPYRSRRPRVRAPPPVSRKYMYERAGGVGARIRSKRYS
jgi:hypothetical protein